MAGFSIRRDALYEEIWSLSATKVAEKYDLSYARLLKACRENDIPIPPPGYYTKLSIGKPVDRAPFCCAFCCMSDHTAGGHPAVLRSDHASRRHDAGRLYVNVQDSFSCAGSRGDETLRSGFHRHHITRPSKSFSRFENFEKRCDVRLCWYFCVFPIS